MLVDYPALVLDLRGALSDRASWGRGQILGLIDELEQRHRIDEASDAAVIRRYGDHLHDCFMGTLPPATSDPLSEDGRRAATSAAMDDGATSDSPGGNACRPTPSRLSQARSSSPSRTPVPALT